MEIIKEALKSIIRRLDKLEFDISKLSVPDNNGVHKPVLSGQATEGQINYIKALGGVAVDLTKKEAGKLIDNLLKEKKLAEQKDEFMEREQIEPVPLKLSKKEIEELEKEEALL